MMIRKLAATITAAAAFALALVAPSVPAAAVGSLYVPQTTSLLGCPYIGPCAVVYTVPGGTWVTALCWTDGSWSNGTNRWFQVVVYSGREIVGYINANRTTNQPSLPHC
ncbi:hypothetical protein GA0074692_1145 [Micromonospora pallida]|uniref:SH3 domain-containing protein n=1 Tax=Micromonospora pallida TaxID=145854 RepID=A0A1C6RVS9_9ACTN|nr:hypothetical protein [Micromonospora pallida]SCL21317.1 hypothetical protein GA0074692_1145 [Micromonospora pallida]